MSPPFSPPPKSSPSNASPSLSRLLKRQLLEDTRRLESLQDELAATAFGVLRRLPFVGVPARLAERVHAGVSGSVFAALRLGGGTLLEATAALEESASTPGASLVQRAGAVRAAINALAGEDLAAQGSALAIPMTLIPESSESSGSSEGTPRRLVVYVHGFACDENLWQAFDADAVCADNTTPGDPVGVSPFAANLAAEVGATALYLRYNTGLAVADNARAFGDLLDARCAAWAAVPEIVLVGHSAGGLLARCACEAADDAGAWPRWPWQRRTRLLVCLATPHAGAPVEKLADWATQALARAPGGAEWGRAAVSRRAEIERLRETLAHSSAGAATRGIAYRLLGVSLAQDVEHPLADWLGDGMVSLSGATASPSAGDVETARIGGVGHLAMLSDARVQRCVRDWVAAVWPRPSAAVAGAG
ncbi:hypothetical protein HCX48_08220 [Rhodocyclus tenuis]|uniref:GPI inositol-deacylase PGAP1-like alpha/beta domain-containing protein n=1 Tax=Rhodocyclus gracilis TaxID=2929842 RepID=A0ABX0WHL8_9RHOO|nr:hypothetical protein [Rhodocyclus gracilis]NJA89204.1 hypothetical protein [Rhodocyclus gracilis]